MKISYNWLKQYISPIPSPEETARLLTDTGLEVESSAPYESIRGSLKGLVTGKVIECTKHPQADRLSLTKVNCGESEPRQIVCGAPNVRAGQYVIVALPGTTLYPLQGDPFTIKESKIRGEFSQGMICAEDEIGLGESHDGIIVLPEPVDPGTPASVLFKVAEDVVFEIGLTPNRIDAASHFGVARDLRASLYMQGDVNLLKPQTSPIGNPEENCPLNLLVERPEALSRYSGICIENIRVQESPDWLKQALKAIGLKPINNVVDISNYVLHETGQPLHAFDLDKISSGCISLNTFPAGTPFVTLDGVQRTLQESDLMICNSNEPMCIAGVFGGLHSGVSDRTTRIFLESARFNPTWIRKTARHHNLNTDAAFRFERGSDPEITVYALQRAADLISELTGGKILGGLMDWYPEPEKWIEFFYPWWKLDRLAGFTVPRNDARSILEHLEIKIIDEHPDGLQLSIPPFKTDVCQEEDVTEEILRIYGYNRIPIPEKISSSFPEIAKPDVWKLKNHISDHLAALGFSELLNNSLAAGELAARVSTNDLQAVSLLNPLSQELNVLRNSPLFGICEAISWNQNRQQQDLSFFEWGKTYARSASGKFIETPFLALALSGQTGPENWNRQQNKASYFHLKGVVERVFDLLGIPSTALSWEKHEHTLLTEVVAINYERKPVGLIGKIGQDLSRHFGLDEAVWAGELNWEDLLSGYKKHRIQYQEVPKFPQVRRDLSLLLNEDVAFADLRKAAENAERKLLQDVQLFDVYAGKNLPSGKKSYALSFTFLDSEKTLTDEQISKAMQRILQSFIQQFGAELRG
jgi:phenylalanyl-tRNA synthetase beta chain